MGKSIYKFDKNQIINYNENNDKGYIFKVDVEYPKQLHNPHNDLPLLPERLTV